MYKKEIFRKLDKNYKTHLYTGLQGFIIKNGHHKLENFKKNKTHFSKILEIGAGSTPHYNFVKHTYDEYHIVETYDYAVDLHANNQKVKLTKYNGKIIPYPDETFDRIIISHCLEHILSPENFIFEMMRTLKKGGDLSISLPTDPGLAWRLGRLFIGLFKVRKSYNLSFNEFEYLNATEHVNSIFNLLSIIRYNYKGSIEESFYPLKMKLPDLNLIYNVHIIK